MISSYVRRLGNLKLMNSAGSLTDDQEKKNMFWIAVTKQSGEEYEENMSNYSKYIRQRVKADKSS